MRTHSSRFSSAGRGLASGSHRRRSRRLRQRLHRRQLSQLTPEMLRIGACGLNSHAALFLIRQVQARPTLFAIRACLWRLG